MIDNCQRHNNRETNSSGRDIYWDSLKFALIFLVVYAHTISPYKTENHLNMCIYNFIYIFHMPLFIFISGRFSHIHDRKKYKRSIWRLIESYAIFQIILAVFALIRGEKQLITCLTTPIWILWYIPALVYWRLLVYYTPSKYISHQKTILTIGLCICFVVSYLPIGYTFVIHRALSFFPFFIMGYYSTDYDINKCINKIPYGIALGVFFTIAAIIYYATDNNFSYICHRPYWDWDIQLPNAGFYPMIKCIYIITAFILCVMFMRLIPQNQTLSRWGRTTLFIYLFHAIILKFLLFPLINRLHFPQNELLLFLYAMIVILLLLYIYRYNIFTILLNPISYYRTHQQPI